MIPRGLAAAVVATIPLTIGIANAEIYPQIVFVIILSSVIITTVALTKAKAHVPADSNNQAKPNIPSDSNNQVPENKKRN